MIGELLTIAIGLPAAAFAFVLAAAVGGSRRQYETETNVASPSKGETGDANKEGGGSSGSGQSSAD